MPPAGFFSGQDHLCHLAQPIIGEIEPGPDAGADLLDQRLAFRDRRMGARPARRQRYPELMYCVMAATWSAIPDGCVNHPTRQPVIAQALEKLLTESTPVAVPRRSCNIRWRRAALKVEPIVDLVADQPDAGATGEIQQRLQFRVRGRSRPVGLHGA